MLRVQSASRLHFGLLHSGTADATARRFGGAGLMVESPALNLTVQPASEWSAEGSPAEQALAFAQRFLSTLPAGALHAQRIVVEQCPPRHIGLGTGTQLGMAVAHALAHAAGLQLDHVELAQRVGRGVRSGLGVHGFRHGGFLVDGGKGPADSVAPLVARMAFPEDWRVVLVLPRDGRGRHGADETAAFQRLQLLEPNLTVTESLCRLLLLGMLPALAEHDLPAFGEALFEYNARSGELFAPVQGGIYADPRTAALVALLRAHGVRGVGQSSWGPAVFAVVADVGSATDLTGHLVRQGGLTAQEVSWTRAANTGAMIHPADRR